MLRTGFSVLALLACVAAHPLAQSQTQPPTKTPTRSATRTSAARAAKPAVTVNINTASTVELEQLPGVGATTAARIIDYRQKKGPFKKIEELMNVQGIGEKNFLKLRGQLTISGQSSTTASQQ